MQQLKKRRKVRFPCYKKKHSASIRSDLPKIRFYQA